MSDLTVQSIGSRVSQWGEGPVWWDGHLLYVDIKDHKIVRLHPDSGEEEVWDVGERIGTVTPRVRGGFVYAGDCGISIFDPETGAKENLADPEADKRPDNRFNDGKCDPMGRFWAGTISTARKTGAASLYMLDTNHTLHLKISGVTNSNGLCWTDDAKIMYYIDTPTKSVRAYDYDNDSGEISNARIVVDTAGAGYDSAPDGMTIDADDRIWVAFCHGGCVVCFEPGTGAEIEKVELPVLETTACTFGGSELNRLFVTTGIQQEVDEPEAGKIFAIDGLGVSGRPAAAYRG